MKRNFGFGVYITAFARYNLIRAIVRNCPKSFVYADTDSIKKLDDGVEFVDTNERLEQYVHEPSLYALGQFEDDGHYDSFRTLGAKKYAYTTGGSDVVHLTVAGLPKVKRESDGSEHIVTLKHIDDFKPKTEFRDVKNGHVYINNTITDKVFGTINGTNPVELDTDALLREQFMRVHKINDHGGVAISSCDYTLDITDNDALFIFNIYGRLVDGVDRKELRDYQKKLIRRK